MGLLIISSVIAALVMFTGATGQVMVTSSVLSPSTPGQMEIKLSLINNGWVAVRADLVIRTSMALGNGSTVEKDYYENAVTVGARAVTSYRGMLSVPQGGVLGLNVTAYLRIRGPISETMKIYRLP